MKNDNFDTVNGQSHKTKKMVLALFFGAGVASSCIYTKIGQNSQANDQKLEENYIQEFQAIADDTGFGDYLEGCELVCENHGYNETTCNGMMGCEFDDGQCWSAVGPNPCDYGMSDMEEDFGLEGCELVCENHGFNETTCNGMMGCEFDDGQCWSAVGPNECDYGMSDMEEDFLSLKVLENCELVCENHGYNRTTCNGMMGCEFDDEMKWCWSAVGPNPCDYGMSDMEEDFGLENCELVCENHGYNRTTCNGMMGCEFDDEMKWCWSAVGPNECDFGQ